MAISFLKKVPSIDFIRYRFVAYAISIITIIASIAIIFLNNGLRYGVDFAGGVMVQVQFNTSVADEQVKNALNPLNIPSLVVQQFGDGNTEYLIRFSTSEQDLRDPIIETLNKAIPNSNPTIQRLEMVGPKVGEDLKNSALEALFYAVLLIVVYISGRFEHRWFVAAAMAIALGVLSYTLDFLGLGRIWQVSFSMLLTIGVCYVLKLNFAVGAILALLHDVFIALGILTLVGKEIDLNIIAALLTIIGYSLNDTIIIYDRIRENLKIQDPENPNKLEDIINLSTNQTLSRTLLTGGTTLVAVLSLFILGGGVIHDFAFTMLLGVIIGTFSSIFVASPLLLALGDEKLYVQRFQEAKIEYEKPGEHGIV